MKKNILSLHKKSVNSFNTVISIMKTFVHTHTHTHITGLQERYTKCLLLEETLKAVSEEAQNRVVTCMSESPVGVFQCTDMQISLPNILILKVCVMIQVILYKYSHMQPKLQINKQEYRYTCRE